MVLNKTILICLFVVVLIGGCGTEKYLEETTISEEEIQQTVNALSLNYECDDLNVYHKNVYHKDVGDFDVFLTNENYRGMDLAPNTNFSLILELRGDVCVENLTMDEINYLVGFGEIARTISEDPHEIVMYGAYDYLTYQITTWKGTEINGFDNEDSREINCRTNCTRLVTGRVLDDGFQKGDDLYYRQTTKEVCW